MDKQVTSTHPPPNTRKRRGGGGALVTCEPAISVDLEDYDTCLINLIIGRLLLMERVERKPNVAACEDQRRRPAYTFA